MANTWGTNFWGVNEFGLQDEINVDVTGSSVTTGTSQSTTKADANVFPQGIGLSVAVELVTEIIAVDVFVQGISITIQPGLADANPDANVIGQSLTTAINGVTIDELGLIGSGWGRANWGDFVWGDNYSVQTGSVSAQTAITGVTTQANADVQVQGQSLTIITGDEVPEANANVFPDGVTATTDIGEIQALRLQGIEMSTGAGTVDIQAGGNVFINVAEHGLQTAVNGDSFVFANYIEEVAGTALQTAIGDEVAFTDVTVELGSLSLTTAIGDETAFTDVVVEIQGQQLNTFIGDEDTQANANVDATGSSITGVVGDPTFISIYSVTGIGLTAVINSVTVQANADVPVTGSDLTVSTISPNIIAWAEVDTGTPVNWTPVDLAA
jgi:hypothetical protein